MVFRTSFIVKHIKSFDLTKILSERLKLQIGEHRIRFFFKKLKTKKEILKILKNCF